jgi:ATP-binding cassette, subfamily B, bacterial
LTKDAVGNVIAYSSLRPVVNHFSQQLQSVTDEIRSRNSRQADIQFQASVSPTAGLAVKDLWAAHTTRRAWAVRGANLECKNGEVLVVLGDDGSGKSRLLTSLAETMVSPPKRALTANKVRGSVSVGGVDVSKWDRSMLKRRLGLWLSDVRTIADLANTVSGNSLEEILEPIDGIDSINPSHKITASEKAAIILALKITGLYSTLLPKLPSKLSTIITASEEDLKPSLLGSQSCVLSPAEWSKVLLTRILAQAIYDNDNSAASSDRLENSLMGSVLMLDEPAALLSEVEEARFLKELRKTSAATIVTSNKWATGRLGDRIAVLKDGTVVESGTHNELLARGPQGSLYAAKWHEMTMQ